MKNLFRMFWKWILGVIAIIKLEIFQEINNERDFIVFKWKSFRCGKNMNVCKLIQL